MSYDAIVIGGGHNGLTTAAYLAKAGRKVMVLERRSGLGGLAAAEEIHAGHRTAGILHDTCGVRPHVVAELGLEQHGLRWTSTRPDVLITSPEAGIRLAGETDAAMVSIAKASPADAAAYPGYRNTIDVLSGVLRAFLDEAPVDMVDVESIGLLELMRRALRIRRLGREHMMELLRIPPMCVADWLGESFQSELLRAGLAIPAVAGSYAGPWSPGTSANLLFYEAGAGRGLLGGGPALIEALARAVEAQGGQIRRDAAVERVLLSSGAVIGVRLADGEEIGASVVAGSCHPQILFFDLLPPGTLPFRAQTRMEQLRSRGTTSVVQFAVSDPPTWKHADGDVEFARVVTDVDGVERAFDAVKYRELPAAPVLEVHVPPQGKTVTALVHFTPYDLAGGWDDTRRASLVTTVQRTLENVAPGFASSVVDRRVLTPVDLESELGLVGGNILHGEHALDQRLIRPIPECVGGRSPVPGLYLCGSGIHPGGGLTCGPGARAAATILAG